MTKAATDIAREVAEAPTWNARVALVRQIPEAFGRAQLRDVYAAVARQVYVPALTPDFAYVHYRVDYDLPAVATALEDARVATADFTAVQVDDLEAALSRKPKSMRCFRLIVGFTTKELAAATRPIAIELGLKAATDGRIKALEAGRTQPSSYVRVLAETIQRAVTGSLFPPAADGLRSKQERPDLVEGWATVRHLLLHGVPYEMYLHQRHYGVAFRQLLDSASEARGDILEDAVDALFFEAGIPFVRTGSRNQAEVGERFRLTVQPAPDFVLHDASDNLRALLECKMTNDGGTARDKAARFATLRVAGQDIGGVPVFAIIGGLGWTRVADALGPVVQACDGRVFTLSTLRDMLNVEPLPSLSAGPSL